MIHLPRVRGVCLSQGPKIYERINAWGPRILVIYFLAVNVHPDVGCVYFLAVNVQPHVGSASSWFMISTRIK